MKKLQCLSFLLLCLFALLIWLPLLMMITSSFMGVSELNDSIGAVLGQKEGYADWHILPDYPTLRPYVELMLDTPKFFYMFWNSCIQVIPGVLGQLIIALPAAWGFARFRFRGKNILFILYIVLMIMPFQVTMVSSYLVLDRLKLMNTHLALIVPMIFSTYPVFIMEKCFKTIPVALIEAARMDGAGELKIFLTIGVPMGSSGMISVCVLGFLEGWNAIEQPITFLRDKALWPLSLYLPNIALDRLGVAMVASVITMIPALLFFLFGQKYIEEGIVASGIKE
jgi:multiple sugar transport system permease protein